MMPQQRAKRQRDITTLDEFYMMAKDVQRRSGQKINTAETEDRRFREFFGVGVHVAIITWTLLLQHGLLPDEAAVPHLLWTLYFLTCYPKQEEGCVAAASKNGAIDPKTWRKYIWPMIYALSDLESVVVSLIVLYLLVSIDNLPLFQIIFENRKFKPTHDTHMSVDCTDCYIRQKGPIFSSHKFKKKSALRYEVALCIGTGEIVWINGPFPAGEFNDITIFRECLQTALDDGERVEADDGYRGDPTITKVPADVLTRSGEEEDAQQRRTQGRHETVNARLKNFKILVEQYRHDETQHGYVFRAVACLVQIALKNGDPLYNVNYKVSF
jgi:hypothetical protein